MIVTGAVIVICVGLFIKAYRSAGPDANTTSAAGGGTSTESLTVQGPSATPTPTASPVVAAKPNPGAAGGSAPRHTISLAGPGGFTIVPPPGHRLVLTVTSTVPIGRLGYLVPTSRDHSSGDIRNVGTHWSLRTTVYGKPDYAAIFIAASAGGAPTTCTIRIDGVVKSRQTTHGPYGRALCAA